MTDTIPDTNSGSFSDPSMAAKLRDILGTVITAKFIELSPTRMTGIILDIYEGGPTFNSDITVGSTLIPRTADNPMQPYVARVRCDDKFEGKIIEARIDPNLIPIFRKADYFDEDNPSGSGTMVDNSGRYVTVAVTGGVSSLVDETYPSLNGTTLLAPQAAPRVAVEGSASSWRVSELLRGVLAIQTNPTTLMIGPDYANFDTSTLTWGGTIAFARGSEIHSYDIYPDAPIVTYGGDSLVVGSDDPVEIVLGPRSGSMYLNFSATDNVPVLVWVEADSDTPIPPEWYLIFARINNGTISSKLVFSSLTDFRSASAPTGLTLSGVKSGFEKVNVTASWDAVTQGTNGDSIIIDSYELWGSTPTEDWRRVAKVTETTVSGLTFDAGSDWTFRVRAICSNGIPGVFSITQHITLPDEDVEFTSTKVYWLDTKPITANDGDELYLSDEVGGFSHWVWSSGTWVLAPFNGTAIANAAIGTAQISELDVSKITGNIIDAKKLAISATGDSGQKVLIDGSGIKLIQSDGVTVKVNLPTDGTANAIFNGIVNALGLTVSGDTQFFGTNYVNPSSKFVLNQGIVAPSTAPTLVSYWDTLQLKDSAGVDWSSPQISSLTQKGTGWLGFHVTNSKISEWDASGNFVRTVTTPPLDNWKTVDFVYLNNFIYRVSVYNSSGSDVTTATLYKYYYDGTSHDGQLAASYTIGTLPNRLATADKFVGAIATDGTYLYVGYENTSNQRNITKITIAGVIQSTLVGSGHAESNYCIQNLALGNFDIGSLTYAWNDNGYQNIFMENSSGAFLPTEAFHMVGWAGFGYDATGFWSCNYTGLISRYVTKQWADGTWPGDSIFRPFVAGYTYYDSNSTGGLHESAVSPYSVATNIYKRSKVMIQTVGWTPDVSGNDTVNNLRWYFGSTVPTAYLQGNGSNPYVSLSSFATGTGIAPTTSNFPSAIPAKITSADGSSLVIASDGTISLATAGSVTGKIKNADSSLVISGDGTIKGLIAAAKMEKTTAGHTTAGTSYASGTWVKVTGFDSVLFSLGITASGTNGELTIIDPAYYDIDFFQRWPNYSTAAYRIAAIMLGTSSPPTTANGGAGSGILGFSHSNKTDWDIAMASARGIYLIAGQVVSFWIRSGASAIWNTATDSLINKPPFVYIRRSAV